jgi:hypothetical protein
MNAMFFPSQYKKVLVELKKNITIRYGNEFGKYKQNKIYALKSYAGRDMKIKVKILRTTKSSINGLKELGINANTIKKLKREHKGPVELIRFKVV